MCDAVQYDENFGLPFFAIVMRAWIDTNPKYQFSFFKNLYLDKNEE